MKFKPLILVSIMIVFSIIGFIPTIKTFASCCTVTPYYFNPVDYVTGGSCASGFFCATIALAVNTNDYIVAVTDTARNSVEGNQTLVDTQTNVYTPQAQAFTNFPFYPNNSFAQIWTTQAKSTTTDSITLSYYNAEPQFSVYVMDGSSTWYILQGQSGTLNYVLLQQLDIYAFSAFSAPSCNGSGATSSQLTTATYTGCYSGGNLLEYTGYTTSYNMNRITMDMLNGNVFQDQAMVGLVVSPTNNPANYISYTTVTSTQTAYNTPSTTNYNWIIFAIMLTMFTGIGWFIVGYVNVGDRKPIVFISMFTLFLGALFGALAGYGNSTNTAFIPLGVVFIYGSGFVLYLIRGVRH